MKNYAVSMVFLNQTTEKPYKLTYHGKIYSFDDTMESISSGALMIGKKMAKEFGNEKGFLNLEVTIHVRKEDEEKGGNFLQNTSKGPRIVRFAINKRLSKFFNKIHIFKTKILL